MKNIFFHSEFWCKPNSTGLLNEIDHEKIFKKKQFLGFSESL